MDRIYDNIEANFIDGLREIVSHDGVYRVDFCTGYFNLRGWNMIADQIDGLEGTYVCKNGEKEFRACRLLVGMYRPPEELIRQLYDSTEGRANNIDVDKCRREIAMDFRRQLLLCAPNDHDEDVLRLLYGHLKDGCVRIKLYMRDPLNAKLYLAYNEKDGKTECIIGSSNLTFSGLAGQGELNIGAIDDTHIEELSRWFDDRWNDVLSVDITEELTRILEESWVCSSAIPPYYIYLKTAYCLSRDVREGIDEFSLSPEFENELFDFQKTAVKIAAHNLEKTGGAMIGDVVGLGKTITACAIAKIYETAYGGSSLVICPANLVQMWRDYVNKYDLKTEVWSMSDKKQFNNKARRYRLVIIDESHNLRNGGKRYEKIKNFIESRECNVLLLTATPYNKDYSDVANQLKLFLSEDQDLGIRPEKYLTLHNGVWDHPDIFVRSIKAFEKEPSEDDWNELMRLFLVRRTRTFIKDHYAKFDKETEQYYLEYKDGRKAPFPDRIPMVVTFKRDKNDQFSRFYSDVMVDYMMDLKLPRYGLASYIDEQIKPTNKDDKKVIENLSRAGSRMKGFCMSTFFKRMDSSGYAFLLTLNRHLLRNMLYIYALKNKIALPIGDECALPDSYVDDYDINSSFLGAAADTASDVLSFPTDMRDYQRIAGQCYSKLVNAHRRGISWISYKYFRQDKQRNLKRDLKEDCDCILKMIELCGAWKPQEDRKLDALEKLLKKDHCKDKVLIFTQYSDTAKYIYRQLKARGIDSIECVTGETKNITSFVERFSPTSNGIKDKPDEDQLRVLVSTDVLSEGQNLQDAHVVVNYDLPWAIIRLIQRAGRVDRIGQKERNIYCYSFFPDDGVEDIIKLRRRLEERIRTNAEIFGSDEVFFEGNEQNLRTMYTGVEHSLDEVDTDVDLASQAYQVWKEAYETNPKLGEIIPSLPDMVYSTKSADNEREDGVISYARTSGDFDILTWLSSKGEIISQSQFQIFKAMACSTDTPTIERLDNHHDIVKKSLDFISRQRADANIGVDLGNKRSPRYRIFSKLKVAEQRLEEQPYLFINIEDVRDAIDELCRFPLTDIAATTLGQMMNNRITDGDIIDKALGLYREGRLCRRPEDSTVYHNTKLICSMGLSYDHSA